MAQRGQQSRKNFTTVSAPVADSKRPLIAYLRGVLASLTPIERAVGQSILGDPERVLSMSIAELSAAAGASVGSIISFCKRMDCAGFADFKIALATDLAQSALPSVDIKDQDSLLARVVQYHIQCLSETLLLNDEAIIIKVARALRKARRIEFLATGTSFPVGYMAHCKLLMLGMPSAAQFDHSMQLISATSLGPGDVAFAISSSGTAPHTLKNLKVAKSKGATAVCLTNVIESPLANVSDMKLYATPNEVNFFQAPISSRVTQFAIIDALYVAITQIDAKDTARKLQRTAEHLVER